MDEAIDSVPDDLRTLVYQCSYRHSVAVVSK
jgi:hypothetical protein